MRPWWARKESGSRARDWFAREQRLIQSRRSDISRFVRTRGSAASSCQAAADKIKEGAACGRNMAPAPPLSSVSPPAASALARGSAACPLAVLVRRTIRSLVWSTEAAPNSILLSQNRVVAERSARIGEAFGATKQHLPSYEAGEGSSCLPNTSNSDVLKLKARAPTLIAGAVRVHEERRAAHRRRPQVRARGLRSLCFVSRPCSFAAALLDSGSR
jgi:hypothetical protein